MEDEKLVFEARVFSSIHEDGHAVLRLVGDFDSLDILKKVIKEAFSFIDKGIVDIVIEMKEVSFLSSYAVGMFVALEVLLRAYEGSLTLNSGLATGVVLQRAGLGVL